MELLKELSENLINGNAPKVEELTQKAIDDKIEPGDILNKGLVAGMEVVGDKFKNNEFYVPEVLIAARAMKAGMKLLTPLLAESGVKKIGTVVIGTIKGDLHDIGKNLVGMMLEGAGFNVIDLGVDVSAEKFAEAVKEKSRCGNPEQKGRIDKVIRPGYQILIDEENIRIVRPAQVRLYA